VTIVAVCEDLGVSGAASLEKRPGLLAALDALETHGAGLLLVAKRDRLARSAMNAAMVEHLAGTVGAKVVTAEGDNGKDPDAWLIRSVKDMLAQYELLQIRARTKAALAVKKSRGERVGTVPYGYTLATDGLSLCAHTQEQQALQHMRALRAEGLSLRAIGNRLAAMGILTRTGQRWAPQTLARILAREPAA
jgi:DNA invertase Pin-like site-specific DNA recombinase